jgi:Domain of unknown function (DUF4136)
MSERSIVLTILLASALAGCAATTPDVRVDKADADLSKCRTFDWLPASKDAVSLTEQRVRTAVMQELERKGYSQATDNPDCRITYLLATEERAKQKPSVGVGASGGSYGVGGGIGIRIPIGQKDQHTGEFSLDVIDVPANAQIWRGAMDAAFENAEPTEEETQDVVRRVLAQFPDRSGGQ